MYQCSLQTLENGNALKFSSRMTPPGPLTLSTGTTVKMKLPFLTKCLLFYNYERPYAFTYIIFFPFRTVSISLKCDKNHKNAFRFFFLNSGGETPRPPLGRGALRANAHDVQGGRGAENKIYLCPPLVKEFDSHPDCTVHKLV